MTPTTDEYSSITGKAVGAMRAAVAKVVAEHARAGRPLAVWRDGKVVMISPWEAEEVDEAPGEYRADSRDGE